MEKCWTSIPMLNADPKENVVKPSLFLMMGNSCTLPVRLSRMNNVLDQAESVQGKVWRSAQICLFFRRYFHCLGGVESKWHLLLE